jgi:two-component system, LytTR family, response regulator
VPASRAACRKPAPVPTLKPTLEGFCADPLAEEHVAVTSNGLLLFVRLADVEWLEANGKTVTLHLGPETHALRETLEAIVPQLPAGRFLHISSQTLVNLRQIKDLQPLRHGRCGIVFRSGARLTFLRS